MSNNRPAAQPAAPNTASAPAAPVPAPAAAPADVASSEQPEAAAKAVGEAQRTSYKVAPGRTVGTKGPGETVELDEGDATRFLELGFILDDDGKQRFNTGGPAVHVEDGVQVKPAS